jgi:hypothetical protein
MEDKNKFNYEIIYKNIDDNFDSGKEQIHLIQGVNIQEIKEIRDLCEVVSEITEQKNIYSTST